MEYALDEIADIQHNFDEVAGYFKVKQTDYSLNVLNDFVVVLIILFRN